MESLRRQVVYQGVTYTEYEMDFYTSDVYSKRFKDKGRALKHYKNKRGYCSLCLFLNPKKKTARVHELMAQTFPDLLPKSPLVSYYNLQIGRDPHILKTPTGFTFLCNMVCLDHIDGDPSNNYHSNLMIVTQFENLLKRSPMKGKKYKGLSKTSSGTYRIQIEFPNILDENGKRFYLCKRSKTEEEAALAYNTMLEEALLTVWGPDLGPKIYDLAYKNEVPTPVQQQLILK